MSQGWGDLILCFFLVGFFLGSKGAPSLPPLPQAW